MKCVHYCVVDSMYLQCMRYERYSALEMDHLKLISDWRASQESRSEGKCDIKDILTPKIKMEFDPEEIERRAFYVN